VLHEDLVTAPQFENGDGWAASPLLVCGADAYVDGEYCYQDYIFDDHGANTTDTPLPPHPGLTGRTVNGPTIGDLVYPTDEDTYRSNAADLLEFRVRPVATESGPELAYRFTLNTMTRPNVAAVAVGIDTTAGDDPQGATDWGYGLGKLGAPADHVLVAWGTGAELDCTRLADDRVSVDTHRNQIEVNVPLDPGRATWRHYCLTGLWDGADEEGADRDEADERDGTDNEPAGRFVEPTSREPTADRPGGGNGTNPPPVFNVGFRFDEPLGNVNLNTDTPEREVEQTRNNRGSRGIGYGHWREHDQARALANRDISGCHADIDFGRLRDGVVNRRIPTSGYLNRLYSSRVGRAEGVDTAGPVLTGRVQPYTVYIPEAYDGDPVPLHVELHGNGATYNQTGVYTPNYLRTVGERRGAIVLAVEGRGPGLFYQGLGELDIFEAWNDLTHRYAVDDERVTLGGYSMGGFGTFLLGGHYPDLFARGFSVVGAGERTDLPAGRGGVGAGDLRLLENLRHVDVERRQRRTRQSRPLSAHCTTTPRTRVPPRVRPLPRLRPLHVRRPGQVGARRRFPRRRLSGPRCQDRRPTSTPCHLPPAAVAR
jgi:hypothetical protein